MTSTRVTSTIYSTHYKITEGAFFCGYSVYSYSGLGITENTEFQFRKERSYMFQIWKRIGGDLRTTISAHALECQRTFPKSTRILSIPSKLHSFHCVHSTIGSRMNGMIFRSFRKRNSSQKNTNIIYSENSYSGIGPKERALRYYARSDWSKAYRLLYL